MSFVVTLDGPAAAGKSTTARLLHELFWKHDGRSDAHVVVHFRMGGDAWMLRRDGRSLACTCNGEARALPSFDELGDDTRDRYLLALHDLLSAGDAAFARTIAREMAGGFDLDAGAKLLNYQAKPPAPQSLKHELDRSRKELRQATDQQAALFAREAELNRLKTESNRANAAQAEIIRIEHVGRALEARQALDVARQALAALPEALGRFRGDELETAENLVARKAQLTRQLKESEQTLDLATARLDELHLPETGELAAMIATMAAHLKTVEENAQLARAERINQQTAAAQRDQAMDAFAGTIDPARIEEESIALFDELAAALEKLDRVESDQAAKQAIVAWIGSIEPAGDLERTQAGIRELNSWLRAPDPAEQAGSTASFKTMGLMAAFVLTLEAIVLGFRVHPVLFASLVVPVALVAWLYAQRSAEHDPRADAEQRFARLGIEQPEAWRSDEVELMLDWLQSQASAGLVEQEKAQRWADLSRQRAESDEARDIALAVAESLKQRLGLERALNAESVKLVRQVLYDAMHANGRAREATARLAAIDVELVQALTAFNSESARVGIAPALDGAQATARLKQLQHLADDAGEAKRAQEQARQVIDNQIAPALADSDAQRAALLARIGVDEIDEIAPLAAEWIRWQAAKKRFDEAELTVAERQSRLPGELRLDDWSAERVEQELQEQAFLASRYETLMGEISTIEAELRQAKQGRSVEQALAVASRAESSLRDRREEDIARVLGAFIVEQARQQSDEANLPEVAKQARRLFARITRGQYELQVVPGEPPAFQAHDTISGITHSLEELSSGTRVQLLLAVRAAFVETNERSAKLPLLLDETLANADESRAEAMIEAAFDLAAEGRQLFYFTAQRDEVEKWRAIGARRPDAVLTVTDLATARHIPSQIGDDLLDLPRVERAMPPEPDRMSRKEYRDLIGVSPLGLWTTGDGAIHLWYLIPDLARLYRLLAGDVSTWGQLRSYIDQNAAGQFGLDEDEISRIRARAKLCESIRAGARIGQGMPVTAATLDASGAISPRYVEECRALLDACNGDAVEFLARLHEGAVRGFRGDKIAQLESHFRDSGHLIDGGRLDPSELAHRVRIELTAEFMDGTITRGDLDQMMDELRIPEIGFNRTDQPDRIAAAPVLPVP